MTNEAMRAEFEAIMPNIDLRRMANGDYENSATYWTWFGWQASRAAETQQQTKQKERAFDELRDILGYIENGESSSVKICQDDATRNWCLSIAGKHYSNESLTGVIREAHKDNYELVQPIEVE